MSYKLDNIPGLTSRGISAGEEGVEASNETALAASPNPFNPVSHVTVTLPRASRVVLAVYDASGRFVKEIAGGRMGPGKHSFTWDATNSAGKRMASGLYVYRLTAGDKVLIRRTILAK
jgi:hypothetical protein